MSIQIYKGLDLFLFKCVLLFFYIFNIFFSDMFGWPTWITSRRCILIIMAAVLVHRYGRIVFYKCPSYHALKQAAILHAVLLAYTMCIILYAGWGTGDHVQSRIVKFFISTILASVIFSHFFEDYEEFLKALLMAVMAQCMVIFAFLMSARLQVLADKMTGSYEKYQLLRQAGYMTGIGCAAASGVFMLALGMAASVYFILKEREKSLKWIFCFLIISATMILLARSGIVMVLLALGVLFFAKRNDMLFMIRFVLGIMLAAVFLYAVVRLLHLDEMVHYYLGRLLRLVTLKTDDVFFTNYFASSADTGNIMPELSVKTFIGTGITSGVSGNGVEVRIDGGYRRLLVAYGVPVCMMFYFAMFIIMAVPVKKIADKSYKYLMIFLFLYLFIGEIKEYFIYENTAACTFFALLLLFDKERRRKAADGANV